MTGVDRSIRPGSLSGTVVPSRDHEALLPYAGSEQPVARMVFEFFRAADISAQCLNTAMKAHVHRAENGCAVFHGARDEPRPEAVATEL